MLRIKYKKGEKKTPSVTLDGIKLSKSILSLNLYEQQFSCTTGKFWFCPVFSCHFTAVWFPCWMITVPKVQTKTVPPDTLKHNVPFHTNIIFLDTTCHYPAQWYHLAQNLLVSQITKLWFLFRIFQVTLGNLVAAHGFWPLTWYERVKWDLCHEHVEGLK
jgi:hypothetical protein